MGQTTITVSKSTKSDLREHKPEGMTWDAYLMHLLVDGLGGEGESDETEQLPNAIADELKRIEERIDHLPDTVSTRLQEDLR